MTVGVARSPDLPKAERKLFTVLLCSLRCRTLVLPQAKSSAVGNFTQPIMNYESIFERYGGIMCTCEFTREGISYQILQNLIEQGRVSS